MAKSERVDILRADEVMRAGEQTGRCDELIADMMSRDNTDTNTHTNRTNRERGRQGSTGNTGREEILRRYGHLPGRKSLMKSTIQLHCGICRINCFCILTHTKSNHGLNHWSTPSLTSSYQFLICFHGAYSSINCQ